MFSRVRGAPHKRTATNASTAAANASAPIDLSPPPPPPPPISNYAAPPISPLQMTFDFELPSSGGADFLSSPPSPAVDSPVQLQPGDGQRSNGSVGARFKSPPDLHAPTLPPVSQSSSTDNSTPRTKSDEAAELEQELDLFRNASRRRPRPRDDSDNVSVPRPQTAGGTSSANSTPRMEASLFPVRTDTLPPKSGTQTQPSTPTQPVMSRSFIDSRDKPYSQPARPFLQHNHSSPSLLRPSTPVTSVRGPTPIYSSRISPQPSMQNLSSSRTTYSGSTARPSTQASNRTAFSAAPTRTIGTPYQATADSFPLPQLVATRPKTLGASAVVGGVNVPTHHTSSLRTEKKEQPKKRGRLLTLLQRRRSSQDPDVILEERAARQAQAQALARQRDVLTSGVNKPPPDFDPRIKGKVVHDFSAPREKRNTFDEMDLPLPPRSMQNANNAPTISAPYPPRNASLVNRGTRYEQREQRRSSHTPVFREHLGENPEASRRISSIQAENLENKDFLQRASKHSSTTNYSQESAVLPPFARRSQLLDATQASFCVDDDSSRSSDPSSEKERNSARNSTGEVSPVTARSSGVQPGVSPVSPSSPNRSARPSSQDERTIFESSNSRTVSHLSGSLSDNSEQRASEATAQPYSAILAPPQIETIAEGSVESLPIETTHQRQYSQEPQVLVRGMSIHQIKGRDSDASLPLVTATHSQSDPSQSLLECTADVPTADHTPEMSQDASAFKTQSTPPKLVEKRKSAVGHSRKSSALPKHHPSNASRFSFQFGGESAAEEQALEDKHRKIASREITETVVRGRTPDEEDEDDYFDEDAMDDMDEFEMQSSTDEPQPMLQPPKPGGGNIQNAGTSQSSLYLQQAREALRVPDSDDGSVYDDDIPDITDEREIPYADHPAFRAHSALGSYSRHNSMLPDSGEGYWRDSTIDHYMRDSYYAGHSRMPSGVSRIGAEGQSPTGPSSGYAQDYLSAADALHGPQRLSRARSNSSTQPEYATSSPVQSPQSEKPPVPARDSGNSERNRAVSGMSFGSSADSTLTEAQHFSSVGTQNVRSSGIPSSLSHSTTIDRSRSPEQNGSLHLQAQPRQSTHDLAPSKEDGSRFSATPGDRVAGGASLNTLVTSPRVAKPTVPGHEIDADSSKVASPKSPVSSEGHERTTSEKPPNRLPPRSDSSEADDMLIQRKSSYRDGRRHGSIAGFSMVSPRPESGMSFEDFTKSGFSRVQSPITAEDANPRGPMTPPLAGDESSPRVVSSSSKASSPRSTSLGLGLNVFSGFDFEDRLPSMAPSATIEDASDSDNEQIAFQSNQAYALSSADRTKGAEENLNDACVTSLGSPGTTTDATPIDKLAHSSTSGSSYRVTSNNMSMSSFGGFDSEDKRSSLPRISRKPVNHSNAPSTSGMALGPEEGSSSHYSSRPDSSVPERSRLVSLGHGPADGDIPRASYSAFHQGPSPTPPETNAHSKRNTTSYGSEASHVDSDAAAGKHLPVMSSVSRNVPHARGSDSYDDVQDDMYFDDGNFEQDIQGQHDASFDENAFDDDNFLYRPNAAVNNGLGHRRDPSSAAMTYSSIGSDGPYPSFAIPNAAKARARDSQLLLEDLPLQAPVDPKLIPQRNPSEDAKRLGLSDRAPPVPVTASNTEAYMDMQANLEKYHAALAQAANKAASDGRFLRMPSVSTQRSASIASRPDDARSILTADDRSYYSHDEEGGEPAVPQGNDDGSLGVGRSDTTAPHLTHSTFYSPSKMNFDGGPQPMTFDFGFDDPTMQNFDDDYENDDDLVAAANAEALASDDEGFYGQEFSFFGRPRANSGDMEAVNGGWFGENGDDGLQRNKSLREPNLTPITERSEFSTRNSFIGLGAAGQFPPQSAGSYAPHSPALARMPITPLMGNDITSFDDLRRLRAQAFGESNGSVKSNSNRSSQQSLHGHLSPTIDTNAAAAISHGYFGPAGAPMQFAHSSGSNGSNSNPPSGHPIQHHGFNFQESPNSAASSNGNPFAMDVDATPKRNTVHHSPDPQTARKLPPAPMMSPVSPHSNGRTHGHSRSGSGADSVTYVREPDPEGAGKPRWVLERRRTSEQGNLELVGRELVQGGWI